MENPQDSLSSKLQFGNREQIDALKKYNQELDEKEEKERQIREGELKLFEVTVYMNCINTVWVWAKNKKQAEEISKDESCLLEPENVDLENTDFLEISPNNLRYERLSEQAVN